MKTPSLSSIILASLVLGLVLGAGLNATNPAFALSLSTWIEPLGALWINAVRMTVIPLLMALLLTAIANQGNRKMAALGLRTLGLFTALIGASSLYTFLAAPPLIASLTIDPQASAALLAKTSVANTATSSLPPFSDWLVSLVPSNPVSAAANGDILPLLIFTALFASALLHIDTSYRESVGSFFAGIRDAMLVLIGWIMKLAPVGIFGIVFPLAATLGLDAITALGTFILIACSLISLSIIFLVSWVAWVTPVSSRQFLSAVIPAQIIGFSARSSLAALPATFSATHSLGVKESVSGVVLPVAVTLFKFASPIARTSGSYFIAVLYGIDLGTFQLLTIAAAIGLFSFYSPGIPSGGLLIMAPVYESLGLPVEGIAILIAIDLVVDMFITAANVTANTAATLVLSSLKD
ncbi:MAG: dicarboxylate/amino acid:cation symporter [Pseudohongiellaceae bacterium]